MFTRFIEKITQILCHPKFQADTCSMVVFSWIVGMGLEVGLAGMTMQQSLQTRLVGTAINLLTGGLNGKWLDIVRSTFRAERSFGRRFAADVVAFLTFQAVLYVINLSLTGATPAQILKAVGGATIVCGFAGWPYGLFTNLFRWLFRVKDGVKANIHGDIDGDA